jgi:hypothetical protein
MADYQQSYPGHCDPPSALVAYAILFTLVAVLCGVIGVFVFRAAMFSFAGAFMVGALLSLTGIPEARRVCEQSGGGICPSCSYKNEVAWNS